MGTNVVRLTDRKYMTDLRDRIQDDYKHQLEKRIDMREVRIPQMYSFLSYFYLVLSNSCLLFMH